MRKAPRLTIPGGLLALASLFILGPSTLQGQQEEAPAESASDERFLLFVQVHIEVVEAREEFNQAIAVVHDDPGKEELRSEMDQRLAEIYETHGMSEEEYQLFTLEVSLDQERREEFERLLEEMGGA
ncbi:MAG: hypothetical protein OXH08_12315 [Gammaproteobacteria bacterium]|nr:hypothetical protein [Gammaproteobacteria bacterium]MDE0651337.1 hypothetical protein [Gammaproteobacteria bacterium]MXW09282.1 hypothetical protein [Gammaproteobacteria bacterium]MYC53198.1 hypothetical protein [Gammaproteobacteria bacterium]